MNIITAPPSAQKGARGASIFGMVRALMRSHKSNLCRTQIGRSARRGFGSAETRYLEVDTCQRCLNKSPLSVLSYVPCFFFLGRSPRSSHWHMFSQLPHFAAFEAADGMLTWLPRGARGKLLTGSLVLCQLYIIIVGSAAGCCCIAVLHLLCARVPSRFAHIVLLLAAA